MHPGAQVAGDRLSEELGRGGGGTVFRAHDAQGREVALEGGVAFVPAAGLQPAQGKLAIVTTRNAPLIVADPVLPGLVEIGQLATGAAVPTGSVGEGGDAAVWFDERIPSWAPYGE